jgi:hypothetical protein
VIAARARSVAMSTLGVYQTAAAIGEGIEVDGGIVSR